MDVLSRYKVVDVGTKMRVSFDVLNAYQAQQPSSKATQANFQELFARLSRLLPTTCSIPVEMDDNPTQKGEGIINPIHMVTKPLSFASSCAFILLPSSPDHFKKIDKDS
jgi:hypothetical protein